MKADRNAEAMVAASSGGGEASAEWLAFRYLTGELSVEEVAAVEDRLAEDYELQRALGETVSLLDGLSRSQRRPVSPRRPEQSGGLLPTPPAGRTVVRWPAGLGIAVMAFVAVGWLVQTVSLVTLGVSREGTTGDPTAIVSIWSALGAQELPSGVDLTQRGLDDAGSAGEIEVPGWMLLAVVEDAADGADSVFAEGGPL